MQAADSLVAEAGRATTGRAIPFGRPVIGEAERLAVARVLEGPILTHGPLVREFEAAFSTFTGAPHAVATSSCAAALHLAYMFLGLRPGDEVIVPALTHVATAHAVEMCGARCVFVDAEPSSGNMDLEQIEAGITPRTRAISVVHYLGLPVDMDRVVQIARARDLFVVEDCALAIGARCDDRHVGLHGDAGCFSFYPVKHITTGEGGMLITRRDDVARAAAAQRAFGIDRNIVAERPVPGEYDVELIGNNYRLTEIAAAIGLKQLQRLPGFLAQRKANHETLSAGLARIEELQTLARPARRFESGHYCYALILGPKLRGRRPEMMSALKRQGVGVSVYYPRPVPHLSYYRQRYGSADDAFPVASRLCADSIALPVGPHLDVEDVGHIIASVKDAVAAAKRHDST